MRRDGRVELGRPLAQVGAHAKGYNKRSLGIVWVGRKSPTPIQYVRLVEMTVALIKEFKIPWDEIFGHCEVNAYKTCPNLDMDKFRRDALFLSEISEYVNDMVKRSKEQPEVSEPDANDSEFPSGDDR